MFAIQPHVAWMTGLSVLLALLLVVCHLGLLWPARWALETEQVKKARQIYGWLNRLLNLSLAVAVVTMLLGVSGAVLGHFLRDLRQLLPFLLTMGLYVAPILYAPDMLPADMQPALVFNPFADVMAVIHGLLQGMP